MDTNEKRQEVETLRRRANFLQKEVDREVSNCIHVWGREIPHHDIRAAYTIPGDPPGTMGVDWRGPVHVPAETKLKWKRTCEKCGHKEYTTKRKTTETEADFG